MAAAASSPIDSISTQKQLIEREFGCISVEISSKRPAAEWQGRLVTLHHQVVDLETQAKAILTDAGDDPVPDTLTPLIAAINKLKYRIFAVDPLWQKMILTTVYERCKSADGGDVPSARIGETISDLTTEYMVENAGLHHDVLPILLSDVDGYGDTVLSRLTSRINDMLERMGFDGADARVDVAPATTSSPTTATTCGTVTAALTPAATPSTATLRETPTTGLSGHSFVRNPASLALYRTLSELIAIDLSAGHDQSAFTALHPIIQNRVFGLLWQWSGSPTGHSSTFKMRGMSDPAYGRKIFQGTDCDGVTRKAATRQMIACAVRMVKNQLMIEEAIGLLRLNTEAGTDEAKSIVNDFPPLFKNILHREMQIFKGLSSLGDGCEAWAADEGSSLYSSPAEKVQVLNILQRVLDDTHQTISLTVDQFAKIDETDVPGLTKPFRKRELIHVSAKRLAGLLTNKPFVRLETVYRGDSEAEQARSLEELLFAYETTRPVVMGLLIHLLVALDLVGDGSAPATESGGFGGASAFSPTALAGIDRGSDRRRREIGATSYEAMLAFSESGKKKADIPALAATICASHGLTVVTPTTSWGKSYMALMAEYAHLNPILGPYFLRLEPGLRL